MCMAPLSPLRLKYVAYKQDCRHMFPLIGSGKFITAPIITEEGEPILDPIVLQQINLGNGKDAILDSLLIVVQLSADD